MTLPPAYKYLTQTFRNIQKCVGDMQDFSDEVEIERVMRASRNLRLPQLLASTK